MLVQLHLDHPHEHYTNLDLINGRVLLRVPNTTNVSSIIVKLEGESRTRLMAPVRPDRPDRQRPVLEVHKFLYRTQLLWPQNMRQEDLVANPKASFTINAGNFEYPFQFKIPLNAACQQQNSLSTNVSFANMALEVAKTPTQHVKTTLPPSLSGFPGEAEIRYFVKVTVARPQFFKENPRAIANFTFLPIEPPRPPLADGEAYARRQHQFLENAPSVAAGKKKPFFDSKDSASDIPSSPSLSSVTPRVTVDARLPNPAILTCNQDLPLRVLLKNNSERTKNVYLQMLQIELIGYTRVRAHEVTRDESNSWILASMSNMAIPIGSPTDPVGTECPINPEYWSGKPIPNTVPPSFQACNLSRFYELEVRVGMGYGSYKHGEDQLVVLPLRLPVKVYSGIAPPKALLEATLTGDSNRPTEKPGLGPSLYPPPNAQAPITPTTPTHQGFTGANAFPPAQGAPAAPHQPVYDDAPPSYEDAIGANLPPINGYRGSYLPPPVPEGAPRFSEEKRR
ncbi:hypothetical protein K458DRAFT_320671 [Lentithecium fluviatile CBS 122367]|uniref:Arrestin-like N-terminal domain-containing protein n=1 Tax=Lentithecium fluviatile CBS 122367 TaxID=1168545 RepID=A0A6G1IFF8_9PLEO|nr:hypothetical protein K458DRAFT_320671 [Lentithecium fluviatile CBS 122367]